MNMFFPTSPLHFQILKTTRKDYANFMLCFIHGNATHKTVLLIEQSDKILDETRKQVYEFTGGFEAINKWLEMMAGFLSFLSYPMPAH